MKISEETNQPAWICALDAQTRNKNNSSLFTKEQKEQGDALYTMVSSAFLRSRIFKNYREQFLAVKVDRPLMCDRISREVEELDKYCLSNNIQIHKTKNNIVYRISRG